MATTTTTEHQDEDLLHLLQLDDSSSLIYIYAGAHSWCAACSAFQASPSAFAKAFSQLQQPQSLLIYLSSDVEDEERDAAVKTLEEGLVGERKFTSCISGSRAQEVMRHLEVEHLPALFQVTTDEKNIHKIKKIEFSIEPAESSLSSDNEQQTFRQAVQDYEAGEWSKALRGFSQLVHLASPPSAVDNRAADSAFNIAAILQMLGHTHLAVHYTALTLELRPDDTTAHILLGTVLAATEREAVIKAYRRLVSGGSSSNTNNNTTTTTTTPNPRAEHRLAVLTGEGTSAISAAPDYVKEVFDDLADSFEEKLVQHLQYRVPWELHEAVATLYPPPSSSSNNAWRILDLGVGTGLCGKIFFPDYCGGGGEMIGCDLSPKMVAKAEESKAYTEVHVQDVHDALRGQAPGSLDLVLSADTFIYVGKLDECFALTAQVLRPGSGLFAFSIEVLPSKEEKGEEKGQGQGFRLLESGRYAQSDAYVLGLLKEHGLDLKVCKEIVVRKESTVPIQGRIYVAEKKKKTEGS